MKSWITSPSCISDTESETPAWTSRRFSATPITFSSNTPGETSGGAANPPTADIDPARSTITAAKVDQILGQKGELASGVYKLTIGRSTRMHGHEVGKTMGVNTWAAFAGSDELAVVDGDFAMLESELQGVLKALRRADINIVAIHSHMAGEQPRILFLHYWGIGPVEGLARGLRAALDATATKPPRS